MYNTVMEERQVDSMTEKTATEDPTVNVEIQVTLCPECGTEWETVVTRRRVLRRAAETIQG